MKCSKCFGLQKSGLKTIVNFTILNWNALLLFLFAMIVRRSAQKFEWHKYLMIFLFGMLCLLCNGCIGSKKIADITIDKVTSQLSQGILKYDELSSFHEGLASVAKNGKHGYIDKLGNEIIPCIYDDARDFHNGFAIIEKNEKQALVDKDGNEIIPFSYDFIDGMVSDSICIIRNDGKYGLIDIDGNVVVHPQYSEMHEINNQGLLAVDNGDKWGIIDKNGKTVVPFRYIGIGREGASIGLPNSGLIDVGVGGKGQYINADGEAIISLDDNVYGGIFDDVSRIAKIMLSCRIDKKGNIYRDLSYEDLENDSLAWDLYKMTSPYFYNSYIDRSGKQLLDWIPRKETSLNDFYDGYATIFTKEGAGLINRNMNIVVPCIYDDVDNWVKSPYVEVKKDGKFGCVNKQDGNIVIPCVYDAINSYGFIEGLLVVKKNGWYGCINENNEVIIDFKYDDMTTFSEGFAVVERFGRQGYVDRYGNDTFTKVE